jgi:SAM-dependent methyltransferase
MSLACCPVCGADRARSVVTLDAVPVLCNRLWPDAASARTAPRATLALAICEACRHLWNTAFEPDRIAYDPSYENSLHHSAVFRAFTDGLARRLVEAHGLRGARVVEMGSGQGDFLARLVAAGAAWATGFDPSFRGDAAPGVAIRATPFDPEVTEERGDLVLSRHVLEHLANPRGALAALLSALDPDGARAVYVEVPNALWTLAEGGVWDLIYEHVSYFTPASLRRLAAETGLLDAEIAPCFGGQYLGLDARASAMPPVAMPPDGAEVAGLVAAADALAAQVAAMRRDWAARLAGWRGEGRQIALWGAGSKGVTFLNIVEGTGAIGHVVDISPDKRGRHVPGTGHRIEAPEEMARAARGPIEMIAMNPLYRDEIALRLAELGVAARLHAP